MITLQPGGAASSRAGKGGSAGDAHTTADRACGRHHTGPNSGQLIALNLHPAIPNGPIAVPPGRRTGEFAAGPEGTANAPGTPDIKAGGNGPGGSGTGPAGAGKGGAGNLPAGISIGNVPGAPPPGSVVVSGDPKSRDASKDKDTLMAAARPPRVGEIPRTPANMDAPTPKIEDRVFGSKQIYTLALNMPNLTSAGGSWIIRFAQLEDDHVKAPLSAPVATRTVDPAYPADLIRDGYEGTGGVVCHHPQRWHRGGSTSVARLCKADSTRMPASLCRAGSFVPEPRMDRQSIWKPWCRSRSKLARVPY